MFVVQIPNLSLEATYRAGQCLRWEPIGKDGEKRFVVISGDKVMQVTQGQTFKTRANIQFGCSEDEFFEYWYKYFDVGVDYNDYLFKVDGKDLFLKGCAGTSGGSRLINKGLWETLMEIVLADGLTLHQARNKVREFCRVMTKPKKKAVGSVPFVWYPTPRPEAVVSRWEALEESGAEREFRKDKANEAAYNLALSVVYNEISLKDMVIGTDESRDEARKGLLEVVNLTSESWAKVDMYAFRERDTMLRGKELEEALCENYECDIQEVYEDVLERYDGYRGVIMQYVLCDARKQVDDGFIG